MRGKGLQALDMDAVLPVAHLDLEEACPAADDGVWAVVRHEGGVMAVVVYQYALRSMSCMVSGGPLPAAVLGCIAAGVATSCVTNSISIACSRGSSGESASLWYAGRLSGMT